MKKSQYIEAENYYDMACEWITQREFEKAEKYLYQVLELNSHFIYAYITLAEVLSAQDKYHDLIRVLQNAIKEDPAFDRLYYLIAFYAYQNKDHKKAVQYINEALSYNKNEEFVELKEKIDKM